MGGGRPDGTHRALAVRAGDEVAWYCVVRTDGEKGLLLEFAAPERGEVPRLLLRTALKAARRVWFLAGRIASRS